MALFNTGPKKKQNKNVKVGVSSKLRKQSKPKLAFLSLVGVLILSTISYTGITYLNNSNKAHASYTVVKKNSTWEIRACRKTGGYINSTVITSNTSAYNLQMSASSGGGTVFGAYFNSWNGLRLSSISNYPVDGSGLYLLRTYSKNSYNLDSTYITWSKIVYC